ncbi:hypothetical protein [Larkinella rosea]|uniref:Uncharacterized protein n=1 Tax=Larkinella rosea TaxID=2025312 RepID=A0A3P1BT73_9BACT|nr:hypothetical protein [Larkinella rosea]RRB04109.1 hypothetical protein EHT25_11330 [Larkinella rosea]
MANGEQKTDIGKIVNRKYFWISFWILAGLGFSCSILVFGQGVVHRGLALLWAIAYFALGGLGGLIFGMPQSVSAPDETLPKDEASAVKAVRKKILKENANLFQISDWLTKIIVGAGLVQLKEIPGFTLRVAWRMGQGMIVERNTNPESATTISAAIIIFFTLFGFISGYLLARLIISDMLEEE